MTSSAQQGVAGPDTIPVSKRLLSVLGDIKIAHTVFALPFALLSAHLAFLSVGGYNFGTLAAILVCMVSARTAAMSFNRYLDRDLDRKNIRTVNRSIPAGRAKPSDALLVVIICSILFMASCIYLGFWPMVLGLPTLAWLLGYSKVKRYSALTHLWLGSALAIAPMGAWIAVTGQWSWSPIPLCFAVAFWVAGFDIIYALQDIEFDKSNKVFSIPASFGEAGALITARIFHIVSFYCFYVYGNTPGLNIAYMIALTLVGILLLIEHSMIRVGNLSKVGVAFFTMNGIISIVMYLSVITGTMIESAVGGGP